MISIPHCGLGREGDSTKSPDIVYAEYLAEVRRLCFPPDCDGIDPLLGVASDPVVNGEVWPIDDYLDCRDMVRNGKFPSYADWIAKRPT